MSEPMWYAGIRGEKVGPLSAGELRDRLASGEIGEDTLLWREGMADWIPLSQAGDLAPHPAAALLGSSETALVRCAVSGEFRPASAMLPYGDAWIAPEHKDLFLQGLLEGRQPVSLSWGGYLYRDPGSLARTTWWLIVVSTLLGAATTAGVFAYSLIAPPDTPPESMPGWIAVNASFSCTYLLVFVATMIGFCLWTYRVAANVQAFGAAWVRVSPGWAVGWHFVPVACLWMPYLALADISRASASPATGQSAAVPGIVKGWWGLWVGSNVVSLVGGFLEAFEKATASLVVTALYLPLGVASAWAACRMIVLVTRSQQTTAAGGGPRFEPDRPGPP